FLTLSGSKSNQLGPATIRKLNRSGHPFIYPVLGAVWLMQARCEFRETYQWLCIVTLTAEYAGLQRLT
uniref:Uncharacterized protein n=1 Tax=Globisporangium ultimum (strain ATCC 200006 / CBS 805.95 / DAOM BR144) TaxID=431595 RepID=K3X1V0_GLOUD